MRPAYCERYWRFASIVAAAVAILAYSLSQMWREDSTQANTGFLLFGALLAVVATLMMGWLKRAGDEADLARAIHTELADRVARCCFDYEAPWKDRPPRLQQDN